MHGAHALLVQCRDLLIQFGDCSLEFLDALPFTIDVPIEMRDSILELHGFLLEDNGFLLDGFRIDNGLNGFRRRSLDFILDWEGLHAEELLVLEFVDALLRGALARGNLPSQVDLGEIQTDEASKNLKAIL